MFCPRVGLPPQTQEPRLQLYQGLNRCDSLTFLSTLYYYYIILQYGILYLLQFIILGSTSYITLHYITLHWGWRVIGISGSLIWSKTLMELIFNPFGEFQLSPEGPVNQIHSPHFHDGTPGIFSGLLRSVQTLRRSGVRKATGSYCNYSSLVKLQPWFLSSWLKTCLWAELQPWCLSFQWETCLWSELQPSCMSIQWKTCPW